MNKIFLIVFKIHLMSDKKAHFCYAHVCWWQNETELSTQFVCLILSHLLFFWLDWNANTFQFFIVHEVKGLGPFSLLVQVKLGHFNFTKWICQEYSKFQLWW